MSRFPEQNSEAKSLPLKAGVRPLSLPPDILFKEQALKHSVVKMQLQSLSSSTSPTSSDSDLGVIPQAVGEDPTALLSDELLLCVLSKLPISQHISNSLVCKRWLYLHGRLVRSLKLLQWGFLESGRIFQRFPNLTEIDIVHSCIRSPSYSGILVSHRALTVHIDSQFSPYGFIEETDVLRPSVIDHGLKLLAGWYPNLRKIVVIGASEKGLGSLADCQTLQDLELHCCSDLSLKGISDWRNLQVVKLIGCVNGFYNAVISDIGLTILAQGCKRLVKLELSGCEGSYDGIKAIGQCCQMLEELTLCDHRMDSGWLSSLSYCCNLKTLRLQSCKSIDFSPGPEEHLGSCPTLETLHLQRCQMGNKEGVKALFLVCVAVRELILQDCWGLDDEVFAIASICRRVRLLSLEGCSLLTMTGLEVVILSLVELQRLRVESCNNLKDGEITPEVSSLFSVLKELKWRPDSRSLLMSSLVETGLGKKGGRFFNWVKV